MYSGKPAAQILVTDVIAEHGLNNLEGRRQLNEHGLQAVDATAQKVADMVDELLGKRWDRRAGEFVELKVHTEPQEPVVATCSCGSGIPIQKVEINGQNVTLVALPVIFQNFREAGKTLSDGVLRELLDMVKIYNPVSAAEEEAYTAALAREYSAYCERQEVTA